MRHLRTTLTLVAGVAIAVACSSEPAPKQFKPECVVNQFRACETDACRGSQQCVDPGLWSACACVVLDASYPDVASDAADSAVEIGSEAASDAPIDAPDD